MGIGKNKKECEEEYHKLHGKDGDEDGAGFHCEAAEECKGTKCTVKFIGPHAKECKEHFKGKNLQKIPHKEMKCMAHKEHGKVIFIGKNKKECAEEYHKMHGKDGDDDGAGFHCEAAEECKGTKCTVKFIGPHAKECKEPTEDPAQGNEMHGT